MKKGSLLARVFNHTGRRLSVYDTVSLGRESSPVPRNVYGFVGTRSAYSSRQNWIHYFFKSKVLIPCLRFVKWCFGRRLRHSLPASKEYDLARLFDAAFERSLRDWCEHFLMVVRPRGDTVDDRMRTHSVGLLRDLYAVKNTIVGNDTAYLEFQNILTYNLVLEVNRRCPRDINHLLYSSKRINDVRYFALRENVGVELCCPSCGIGISIPPSTLCSALSEAVENEK